MGFWSGSRVQFEEFLAELNAWSAAGGWNVGFEESGCGAPLDFLDATLYYHGAWHSKVYSKPTDVHAYLPYDSAHARHIVRNIPNIVAIRLRKLCSETEGYNKACSTNVPPGDCVSLLPQLLALRRLFQSGTNAAER